MQHWCSGERTHPEEPTIAASRGKTVCAIPDQSHLARAGEPLDQVCFRSQKGLVQRPLVLRLAANHGVEQASNKRALFGFLEFGAPRLGRAQDSTSVLALLDPARSLDPDRLPMEDKHAERRFERRRTLSRPSKMRSPVRGGGKRQPRKGSATAERFRPRVMAVVLSGPVMMLPSCSSA